MMSACVHYLSFNLQWLACFLVVGLLSHVYIVISWLECYFTVRVITCG